MLVRDLRLDLAGPARIAFLLNERAPAIYFAGEPWITTDGSIFSKVRSSVTNETSGELRRRTMTSRSRGMAIQCC